VGGGTFQEYMGCIKIDDNVFVGANSTILANVHISSNVIIGAGSLVNKDCESGFVYAGVPCKKICTIEQFIAKRSSVNRYPSHLRRNGDSVPGELATWLWDDFTRMRDNR